MITVHDDSEFTILIADFIETLAKTERFQLRVWISGSELPIPLDETCIFHFMQEGFRVTIGNKILWIFYDTINSMELEYES